MKRGLAPVLALAPLEARADHEGVLFGIVVVVLAGEVITVGGSLTTSIGNLTQVGRDQPSLGWTIAGFVLGGIATVWGGIWTAAVAASGDNEPFLWAFALSPLLLGLTSVGLSAMNVVRRSSYEEPDRDRDVEPEEEEWTLMPVIIPTRESVAPGVGAAITF